MFTGHGKADLFVLYGLVADEDRYFCSRTQMPSHPTLGAFKRAMTYSFGSICFGSLVVSIIQLLKQGASIAQQSEAMDGNIVMCCVWAVANCILGLVLWLIEYFNVSKCLPTELKGTSG